MGCGDEIEIEINRGFGISEKERPWNGMTTQVQLTQRSVQWLIQQISSLSEKLSTNGIIVHSCGRYAEFLGDFSLLSRAKSSIHNQ
ncbi:unnamed protein product [Camellia sinensis]